MVTRVHLWTCLSFSVYFLASTTGSGQQRISAQPQPHIMAGVTESSTQPQPHIMAGVTESSIQPQPHLMAGVTESPTQPQPHIMAGVTESPTQPQPHIMAGVTESPTQPQPHIMAGVTEPTFFGPAPTNYMPQDLNSQKQTTVPIPLQNADVSNRKEEIHTLQKVLEHTMAVKDNKTVPSCERLVQTDLLQEYITQKSTAHEKNQADLSTQANNVITLPVNKARIRTSSVKVGLPSENTRPVVDTNSTNSKEEGVATLYVQLGTEWFPRCATEKYCYQKCKKPASLINASNLSIYDTIPGDDIQCRKNDYYGDACSCDLECIVYGDCCPDVFLFCWNISDLDTITRLIDNTRNKLLLKENTDDLVDRLSLDPDSSETILVNVYAEFGSCRQLRYGIRDVTTLLIGRCPSNAEDSLKSKCETSVSPLLPPVYAQVGRVEVDFSNVYCALCHGVRKDKVTSFRTQITCPSILTKNSTIEISMSELIELIESSQCNVTFADRSRPCQPRPCQEDHVLTDGDLKHISSCVQTGHCEEIDAVLCKSYFYPVGGFRNPHCRKCLVDICRVTKEVHSKQANTIHNATCCVSHLVDSFVGGIFLFLDVSGTYLDIYGEMKTKYPCQDNEVFDVLTQECKLLLCPRGQKAFQGQCQETGSGQLEGELGVGSTHTWTTLQMLIWSLTGQIACHNLSSEHLHKTVPDLLIKEIVIKHSREETVDITREGTVGHTGNESWCTDSYESIATDKTNTTSVDVLIALRHDLDLATMEQLKQLPRSITGEDFEVNITSNFDGLRFLSFCQNVTKYSPVNSTEHQGRVYVIINSTREHGVSYLLQSLGYELRISRTNEEFQITETVLLCEDSDLFSRKDCNVVGYTHNETLVNGSGLIVIKSGQFYETNDFEIKEDLIYVCSKFQFTVRLEALDDSTVSLILNLVFSSISVMFLLSMVIIYCVFPSLQTLAGKMTASLAGTMGLVLMANILTFIETHNQYACPVIAVVSHVALLSQFGWMSAIAVNMAVTFGPSTLNNMLFWNSSAHFRRYNFFVYSVSMSIVLVPAILDFLHDDLQFVASPCSNKSSDTNLSSRPHPGSPCQTLTETFDYPRYGYPVCSWFSGPLWARLTFVVVPFAISYIINIVCFIATLAGIHKSSQLTKKLGKTSSDRLQCVIYMKLSTAMGFTWLLSLLGNVLQGTQVIAYLFTVFILLQGLFLFLAFMANKRVFALIRGLWPCAGRSERSSSGATFRSRFYTSRSD